MPSRRDGCAARRWTTMPQERTDVMGGSIGRSRGMKLSAWLALAAGVSAPARADESPTFERDIRSLDVVLPTQATVPAGAEGMGAGGTVQVVLKVGPLPAASALAFRGDGRHLAVGTHGEVVVWDLPDARPATILHDIPGPV